jgi:hypothetical protein
MAKYQLWDMVSYSEGEPMVPFSVINESDNFENIYGKFKNQKDPCVILIKEDEVEKNNDHCHYSGLPSVKSYNKIYESPDGGKTVYQREEGNYNNRVKIK